MSTHTSADRALSISEILENILLFLLEPIEQPSNREDANSLLIQSNATVLLHLLRCSEVNQTWRKCIFIGSQPLRRYLYLSPDYNSERSWEHSGRTFASQTTAARDLSLKAPSLNPIIQTIFATSHFRFWRSGLEAEGPRHRAYLILTRKQVQNFKKAISDGYGKTILGLLVAQPPPTKFVAELWDRKDSSSILNVQSRNIHRPLIYSSTGVTMSLILERSAEMFDDHPDMMAMKITSSS